MRRRTLISDSDRYVDRWPDYDIVVKVANWNRQNYEDASVLYNYGNTSIIYPQGSVLCTRNVSELIAMAKITSFVDSLFGSFGYLPLGEYDGEMWADAQEPNMNIERILKINTGYQKTTNFNIGVSWMCFGMEYLRSVDLRGWKLSQTNASASYLSAQSMCEQSYPLETVHLPDIAYSGNGINASTFLYIEKAFKGCSKLKKVNLGNFKSVSGSKDTFSSCTQLNHIRCTQSVKSQLQASGNPFGLPAAMLPGGSGVWDIVEIGGGVNS